MRVPSLLALAAAGALLLPVAANAGNFPAGKEAAYMTQCTQVASGQGVDAATAKKHCDCGAQAIKRISPTPRLPTSTARTALTPN